MHSKNTENILIVLGLITPSIILAYLFYNTGIGDFIIAGLYDFLTGESSITREPLAFMLVLASLTIPVIHILWPINIIREWRLKDIKLRKLAHPYLKALGISAILALIASTGLMIYTSTSSSISDIGLAIIIGLGALLTLAAHLLVLIYYLLKYRSLDK